MPENWQPGQPIRIPDPSDPTGRTFIEIPADALEMQVIAVPDNAAPLKNLPQMPNIQGDLNVSTS